MRTITITWNGEKSGYEVREGEIYTDELTWDEMLGTVAELTHPKVRQARLLMMTEQGWNDWRERMIGGSKEQKHGE